MIKFSDHDETDDVWVCQSSKTIDDTAKAIYYFTRVAKVVLG